MSNLLNILILYLIFINTFYLYSFYIVVAQHIDIYIIIYMINNFQAISPSIINLYYRTESIII